MVIEKFYYPNLVGEMAKVGMTKAELATRIGRARSTTSQKMSGKIPFTIDECFVIKRVIGSTLTIDDLFSHEIVR